MPEKLKFVLGRLENIVRKGENAGYQHFLLFLQSFQKASFSGSLKVGIVWLRVQSLSPIPTFNKLTTVGKKPLENTVEKAEKC